MELIHEKRVLKISDRTAVIITALLFFCGSVGMLLEGAVQKQSLEGKGDMTLAGAAIALQMLSALSYPVGAYLTVKAYRTDNMRKKLFSRLILLAVIYEPLYDLLELWRGGDVWKSSPLFSFCISVAVLYFYEKYRARDLKSIAIRAAVTASGLLWCGMLSVSCGSAVILLCVLFYFLWERRTVMLFSSAALLSLCSAFEPLLIFSFFGVILVSFLEWENEK